MSLRSLCTASLLAACVVVGAAEPTWGQEPVETLTPVRDRIVLNGLWQFEPVLGKQPQMTAPSGDWGLIRVPGSWNTSHRYPGVEQAGTGGPWKGWQQHKGKAAQAGWYQRPIAIPEAWTGRGVFLRIEIPVTRATVQVDGTTVGEVAWPWGEVDLSAVVRPGQEHQLRIFAVEEPHPLEKGTALDPRGLCGDAILSSRGEGAHIADVFAKPSVRAGRIAFELELVGVERAGEVAVRARMLHPETGAEEIAFAATVPVAAAERQVVEVSWPWAEPRLWDYRQPELYRAEIAVEGAGIDDSYAQEFGFREFWLDGKRFMLNGSEIKLRPVLGWSAMPQRGSPHYADGVMEGFLAGGYNIAENWPTARIAGDAFLQYGWQDLWARSADRKGMLTMAATYPYLDYMHEKWPRPLPWKWDDPGVQETFAARSRQLMKMLRNHPSIVMYLTTGNFNHSARDSAPEFIGMRGFNDRDPLWVQRAEYAREAIAIQQQIDPTRFIFPHHSAYVVGLHSINMYLNMTELQEREEWLAHWAEHSDMALMMTEFGCPLSYTFFRGRGGGRDNTEPLITEFAATWLGREAYRLETAQQRRLTREAYVDNERYETRTDAGKIDHTREPVAQELLKLFVEKTWRSWRTLGITGGMLPWSNAHGWELAQVDQSDRVDFAWKPGQRGAYYPSMLNRNLHFMQERGMKRYPVTDVLEAVNGPLLAYLGDEQVDGDIAAITGKRHNYRAGDRVAKTAVVINDTRAAQAWRLRWQAVVGGETVDQGEASGELAIAGRLFHPIAFTAPTLPVAARVEGELTLSVEIAGRTLEDRFALSVFGREPATEVQVLLHDPVGRTRAMLETLGVTAAAWDGTPGPGLVVIGREALSAGPLPGSIEAQLAAGGRVLLCAQDPHWLRNERGLHVSRHVHRRVFPVDPDHPVLAGLETGDLWDWAGSGTLRAASTPMARAEKADTRIYPHWGWRAGNRGAVASCALEKPHHSGLTPILECGFDLMYTPLAELARGGGKLVFCGLDLEDQVAADPAAERLARQLLTWTATAPLARTAPTRYLGGEERAAQLRAMGLVFEPGQPAAADELLVVDPDHAAAAEPARSHARRGGRVLVLPSRSATSFLGAEYAREQLFGGSLAVPGWPVARGLSASDLRWKTEHPAVVLTGGGELAADGLLARRAEGDGSILFTQTDAALFDPEVPHHRYTRMRQTRALAQLLANLGAAFEPDRVLTAGEARSRGLGGTWHWIASAPRGAPEQITAAEAAVALASEEGLHPFERKHLRQRLQAGAAGLINTEADRMVLVHGWSHGYEEPSADELALVQPGAALDAFTAVRNPTLFAPDPAHDAWRAVDGGLVFRYEVDLPAALAGQPLELWLGQIEDRDDTFWNGERIGGKSDRKNTRQYRIPAKLVRPGRNVLAVRVWDSDGSGGFTQDPADFVLRSPAVPNLYVAEWSHDVQYGDDPSRYEKW